MSETVNDIVAEMRAYAKNSKVNGGEIDVWNWLADYAKRIEAAHKREIDSLNFKLMTAKSEQKTAANVIIEQTNKVEKLERELAAKDAEIARLRECLKEAVREQCPFTRMSCRYGEQCDYECETEKWRNALKGSNNATK